MHYPRVVNAQPQLALVLPDTEYPEGHLPLCRRSDDELMLLARAGKEAALDALIRRHQTHVLRVAARLLGASALAPDVAQNTFLAIYQGLAQYQPRGKFPAYLYRILLNQCHAVRRSARAEIRAIANVLPTASEHDERSDSDVLARESQRRVEVALCQLSAKLRDVVVLRFSGGLSHSEIADTLAVPVGTVKRRLFDAMARLRVALEES